MVQPHERNAERRRPGDATAVRPRLAAPEVRRGPPRRRRRWLVGAALLGLALAAALLAFEHAVRLAPPRLPAPAAEPVRHDGDTAWVGPASLTRRDGLWMLHLRGAPVELGYRHARLAGDLMAEGDATMLALFETHVPSRALRALVLALARFRHRGLDHAFPPARRAEIFGESHGYADRFGFFLPSYERLVYLHAIYDIALAFERSPLLACTGFAAAGDATATGHTIVGRNFDFDVDPWFDREKVVQIVEPAGGLAFVSVSWPGMTGVVTGMNTAGIWISVNGGRAGELDSGGVPVVLTTRAVLEEAMSLDEALAVIARDRPMASHMLLLADGETGESARVERAPGRTLAVERDPERTVVANHYRTAPLRDDPKDARIRDITSTLARGARMDELLARHHGRIDPATALAILRDRNGVGDAPLPAGNRNALDALVATHSVVADVTARRLWVSVGPHTLGRYHAIDLAARLAGGADGERALDLPADPMLTDGRWARVVRGRRLRAAAEAERAAGNVDAARDLYRRAIALRADDHRAWRGLATLETEGSDPDAARVAWARVLALAPESPAEARAARRGADGR